MSNITVDSTAGLTAALATAQGGDTILLNAGTYSKVALNNLHFAQDVTIESANPFISSVITDLKVTNSSGLIFKNLELNVAPGADSSYAVNVKGSDDVHFDGLNAHGTANNNASDDRNGITVTASTNVSVTNSEFHDLQVALNFGNTDGIQVSNNNFHDIRIDGFEGTGASDVTISNNVFTNFHHLDGDHSDAIQFWTAGRTVSAHDILITGNVVVEGSGAGMQGIFLGDEAGNLPYINVTIADNVVLGGNWSAISVARSQNITVTGNDVAPQVRAAGSTLATQARLVVTNADNATITNNQSSVIFDSGDTHLVESGNTTSTALSDTSTASVQAFITQNHDSLASLSTDSLSLLHVSLPFAEPAYSAVEDVATYQTSLWDGFGGSMF